MLSDDYEQEQTELREKLLQLNEDITQQEEQAENIDRFIGKVRKYLDLDELTSAISHKNYSYAVLLVPPFTLPPLRRSAGRALQATPGRHFRAIANMCFH